MQTILQRCWGNFSVEKVKTAPSTMVTIVSYSNSQTIQWLAKKSYYTIQHCSPTVAHAKQESHYITLHYNTTPHCNMNNYKRYMSP